jgi:hypothetical protein
MDRRFIRSAVVFVLVFTGSGLVGRAGDFRVETDVFCGADKEPDVQYLTLFQDNTVYDFRETSPREITLYEIPRNRVVLMDETRKVKVTLTTDQLLRTAADMKSQVDETNSLFFFACHPVFDRLLDEKTNALTLASKQLTYRIKGSKPKNPDTVRRYQEFADWSARLSAMRQGGLPPFARIEVNTAIAEKGWLPDEVERNLTAGTLLNQRKLDLRTRHLPNWTLSETDAKRIARAGDYLVTFTEIPFAEFRDSQKSTANKQVKR